MTDLWYGTSGPQDAEIVLVGEAWGYDEDVAKRPFVGSSGTELTRILAEAGIDRPKILLTNVAAARPANNEMWRFFHAKDEAPLGSELRGLHPTSFVIDELQRLHRQILSYPRRLIIAAGNYALWALTDHTGYTSSAETQGRRVPSGIMDWRGSMDYSLVDWKAEDYSETRLLPIIHPAAIMRQWGLRAITVHDLKARVPMALKGDWRPNPPPVFWAPPTFEQCTSRLRMWLAQATAGRTIRLTEDIETVKINNLITVVGLTDSIHFAMAIPFVKKVPTGLASYWTVEQEVTIVQLLQQINSHPNILIQGQNFLYDTQYFAEWMLVTPVCDFDTMSAQHLLWPGTPKGLDYISSLYCRYHWYWKEDGKEWDTKGTLEDLLNYNCLDLIRTHESADVLRTLIVQLGQSEQWEFVKKKERLALRMMKRGVLIDRKARGDMRIKLVDALHEIEKELLGIIPQEWVERGKSKSSWFNSPKQTQIVFRDILGMKLPTHRKTGKETMGKDAFNELPRKYPMFQGLFDRLELARSVGVFKSHFVDAQLDPDNRMRCFFKPVGTETHRWASAKNAFGRGTNLQNIPRGEED